MNFKEQTLIDHYFMLQFGWLSSFEEYSPRLYVDSDISFASVKTCVLTIDYLDDNMLTLLLHRGFLIRTDPWSLHFYLRKKERIVYSAAQKIKFYSKVEFSRFELKENNNCLLFAESPS